MTDNAKTLDLTATQIDDMARRLVSQDVRYCVSALISNLMADAFNEQAIMSEGDAYALSWRLPDADDFYDYAQHAEREEVRALKVEPLASRGFVWSIIGEAHSESDTFATAVEAWQEAFDSVEEEAPDGSEIFEHWLVTDDLACRLKEQGESVADDVCGMTVWGRATTGQAIYADAVFQRIARNILEA